MAVNDNKESYRRKSEEIKTYVIVPPDGGWGWVVVLASFYCNAVIDGIIFTFGIYLPDIIKTYDSDEASIALIVSCMFGLHLAAGPLCAALTKAFGFRVTTVLGSLITAACLASVNLHPPLWALTFILGIVAGTGMCLVYMTCQTITLMYFQQNRLLAMGIVVCGTGCGTVVFALTGNIMLESMTWQEAHWILAGSSLLMAFVGLAFRPLEPVCITTTREDTVDQLERRSSDDEPEGATVWLRRLSSKSTLSAMDDAQAAFDSISHQFHQPTSETGLKSLSQMFKRWQRRSSLDQLYIDDEAEEGSSSGMSTAHCSLPGSSAALIPSPSKQGQWSRTIVPPRDQSTWRRLASAFILDWSLLKDFQFVLFCISGGVCCTAIVMVYTFEKVRALEAGLTADMATYFLATLGAANMAWRLVLGFVTNSPHVNYHTTNACCLIFGGLAVIASVFADCLSLYFLLSVVCGAAVAAFAVFRPILLVDLVGLEKLNDGAGISLLFTGALAIAGPPLGGYLYQLTGHFSYSYYVAGGLFILCSIVMEYIAWVLKRRHNSLPMLESI